MNDDIWRRWLATLPEHERLELESLSDERAEMLSWSRADTGDGPRWSKLPIVLAGTLVEPDHEGSPEAWHQDFYEYAADQKYIFIEERRFHICTRASAARAALRRRLVPVEFACSERNPSCPMRRTLATCPGRAVRLRLAVGPLRKQRGEVCQANEGGELTLNDGQPPVPAEARSIALRAHGGVLEGVSRKPCPPVCPQSGQTAPHGPAMSRRLSAFRTSRVTWSSGVSS